MGRYTYQVGGGELMKWSREGQEVEGRYAGIREGKQFAGNVGPSMLAMLDLEDGTGRRVAFPANVVLLGKLAQVRLGAGVCITFLGDRTSKGGTTYKDFSVATESPEDILAGRPAVKKTATGQQREDSERYWADSEPFGKPKRDSEPW